MTRPKDSRAFAMALDIEAPQKDVWEALTRAEELVRWFPLHAEVTPGAGGSMRWAWGDAWSGVMRIEEWDPPRFIRLIDEAATPYDADGRQLPADQAAPARVAVDLTLQTINGRTRVTLVHSGFGQGPAWDDELEGISTAWPFELRNLRDYVSHHRGHNRFVAFAHRSAPVSLADAWSQLLTRSTIAVDAAALAVGEPYTATLGTGDQFNGTIRLHIPGREFSGSVKELGDGVFRVGIAPAGGRTAMHVWASTYDAVWAEPMRGLERRIRKMLDGMFEVR